MDDAATRISRYLLTQSLINSIFGAVVGLGLWAIGVPNPLLFGLLCGMLRFIPFIGVFYVLVDCLLIFRESHQCLHDNIADTIVVKA